MQKLKSTRNLMKPDVKAAASAAAEKSEKKDDATPPVSSPLSSPSLSQPDEELGAISKALSKVRSYGRMAAVGVAVLLIAIAVSFFIPSSM